MKNLRHKLLLQQAETILLAGGFSKRACAKVLRASYTSLYRLRRNKGQS
jgi:hypothetical protein